MALGLVFASEFPPPTQKQLVIIPTRQSHPLEETFVLVGARAHAYELCATKILAGLKFRHKRDRLARGMTRWCGDFTRTPKKETRHTKSHTHTRGKMLHLNLRGCPHSGNPHGANKTLQVSYSLNILVSSCLLRSP